MFDWSRYLTLAEDLATRSNDEAALRSAVSRAYYAAFCTARERLRTEGVDDPRLRSHTEVWRLYRQDPVRRQIGVGGNRLMKKRHSADYANSVARLPDMVFDSLKLARELLNFLKNLYSGQA